MQIYLVGGAVRDAWMARELGLPPPTRADRDWVVVGATPQDMVAAGYTPVGRDFPVFLHPRTREEYALARTERKTAPGYRGFVIHAAPDVTLEDDLARRDLTINAMAVPADQADRVTEHPPIDPHGGLRDLRAGVLRHVTPAFSEDPVRILRVARFAARWPGFQVAPDTLALMKAMVTRGEADHLVPERVWQEIARALAEPRPSRLLDTLDACGALDRLCPSPSETAMPGVRSPVTPPGPERFARQAAELESDPVFLVAGVAQRMVWLLALLGRLHPAPLRAFDERLRWPGEVRELALLSERESAAVQASASLDAAHTLALLQRCDALRKPQRFHALLEVVDGLALLRGADRGAVARAAQRLRDALERVLAVDTAVVAQQAQADGLSGEAVGQRIRDERLRRLLPNAGCKP